MALRLIVYNRPGVLFRVVNHFRRLNINIDSLTVAPWGGGGASKSILTVVTAANPRALETLHRMLRRSLDILEVEAITPSASIKRELVLVSLKKEHLQNVAPLLNKHPARIVEEKDHIIVVELAGEPEEVNAFINSVPDVGLVSLSRTGLAVLPKNWS
jgi:acetolactate synthase-1/3 small subunit